MDGKVAIVTGAASGIGRSSAIMFAREGAKVVIADIDGSGGEETKQIIEKAGGEAIFIRVDVTKAVEVEAMVSKCIETYGGLNCAFNNAGIGGTLFTPIADHAEETWDRVISINLKGVWLCMKYELPHMLKQGGGAIVNMSSMLGMAGAPEADPAYIASKHGVVGLTRAAALEYVRANVRVNAVCPGPIDTPLFKWVESAAVGGSESQTLPDAMLPPIGRLGTPEEVAEVVVWLCSDAASYVTGHIMAVDGGFLAQ